MVMKKQAANESPNISKVAQAKLCNTCGACFAMCPAQAIDYRETPGGYYLPVVDEQACNHCGLCRDACPGIHFGDSLVKQMPEDPFAGVVQEAYVGKAADKIFFENSQSGGIVSALLVNELTAGRIKGAVIVTMQPGTPPRPEAYIAKTPEAIYHAQKSKYCPVPLLGFIRELKNMEGPVAVVGISCQIHGLLNILDTIPKLHNKIAFTVGLVCDRILTFAALDYLVHKADLNHTTPTVLHFRDKRASGYPGDVHVFSVNGNSRVVPSKTRMQIKDYFTPARCRLCFDKMNVFSDITVGDPHGLQGVDRKCGESMLVVRTEKGREIVNCASQSGTINIRPVQYEQVLRGQGIDKKREQWRGYIEAWKQMGNTLPDYYAQVKNHAPFPADLQKYRQDLGYSLDLDGFSSRQELIRQVEKMLKKKQLYSRLLYPLRLPWRAGRKMFSLFSGD